jgi:hypothetical protein
MMAGAEPVEKNMEGRPGAFVPLHKEEAPDASMVAH